MSPQPPHQDTRPAITAAVRRGATRLLRQEGYAVASEMVFASGRRADLVALGPRHDILVVEVKSGLADFRADTKWADYRDYADALAFAVTVDFPVALIPDGIGVIFADAYGAEWQRRPDAQPLSAARRKAVTLAFAQTVAGRLMRLDDPDFVA
jgi:hypothetical protein